MNYLWLNRVQIAMKEAGVDGGIAGIRDDYFWTAGNNKPANELNA